MRRRQTLLLAAGCLAGVAGCGGRTPVADTRSPTDEPHGDGDATPSPTPTDGPAHLDAALETPSFLVRSYEQTPNERAIDPGGVVPVSALPAPFRTALEAARDAPDGRFETDTVTEPFLSAVDRFRHNDGEYRFRPFVSFDGTPHAFDVTAPVFLARLAPDVDDPDPALTADEEDLGRFDEPARGFARTLGAYSVEVPRAQYRVSTVPPSVRTFLSVYDYLGDSLGVGRIDTERFDPGPPYSVSVRELSAGDLWGRPVLEAGSLSGSLRQFLSAAVRADARAPVYSPLRTEYRADQVPDAYFERYQVPGDRNPYVRLDGTVYAFRLWPVAPERVPADVSVAPGPEAPGDERSFVLTVTPSARERKPDVDRVELETAGALPSVLWLETGDGRVLLPSDAYDDVEWERAESGPVDKRVGNVARVELASGESVSATYRIPGDVPAGTYRAYGRVGVSWTDPVTDRPHPTAEYPFRLDLAVSGDQNR
jgi:hypothetical protein